MKIQISKITPNPQQPRTIFDETAMRELAESIRATGLSQAILVEDCGDGTYILVDGERRMRAHVMLGLTEIEANVRPLTNHAGKERLVSAVAANIARNALNPVDEARAYHKMKNYLFMSVTEIALSCGTSVVNIYAKLKINKFTEEEQKYIADGRIPTQADALDALLSIPDPASRTEMIRRLGKRNATIKVIKSACSKFVEIKREVRRKSRNSGTPSTELVENQPPEWDALYQVGRVPPWKNFTESIMSTCDKCALRANASDATCGNCPLTEMIKSVMESVK